MNDEVEVSVELSAGGSWSSGPMTMQQLDQAIETMSVLPEKYKKGGPYVYIATRPYCKCPFAIHPLGYDNKAAGRVLAEWGKAGWTIHTIGKAALMLSDMLICTHEAPKEQEPLVYVAERFCGCTVGVQPPIPGGEAGVAKVLQVWAEQGYYIQSVPMSRVHISPTCPHQKPKEKQAMLPGLASADMDGVDDFDD